MSKHDLPDELQLPLDKFKKHMEEVVIPEIEEIMWNRQICAAKSREWHIRC
jgi:hypothetical protein